MRERVVAQLFYKALSLIQGKYNNKEEIRKPGSYELFHRFSWITGWDNSGQPLLHSTFLVFQNKNIRQISVDREFRVFYYIYKLLQQKMDVSVLSPGQTDQQVVASGRKT